MIRKGSVRYKRSTNAIWKMKDPICFIPMNMSHRIAADGTIEFRCRRMPAKAELYLPNGRINIVESHMWYDVVTGEDL